MTTDLEKSKPAEDAEFERWLLDSARHDELPPAAPAFNKFSATLGLLALQAAPTPVPAPAGVASARGRALKWLSVGALAGSALTALSLAVVRSPLQRANWPEPSGWVAPTAPPTQAPTPTPRTSQMPQMPQMPTPSSREPELQRAAEQSIPHIDSRHRSTANKSFGSPLNPAPASPAGRPTPSATRSTLLAEVALLDAVRAKLSHSDGTGALRLLQSYERQFPQGQLASDAAVLSIEALRAAGNRAEAQRRAAAFLERSPDDPHAARVRSLATE